MPERDARIRIHFDAGSRAGIDAVKEARDAYLELEAAMERAVKTQRTFASEAHREEYAGARSGGVSPIRAGAPTGGVPRRAGVISSESAYQRQERDENYAARQRVREQRDAERAERDAARASQREQQEAERTRRRQEAEQNRNYDYLARQDAKDARGAAQQQRREEFEADRRSKAEQAAFARQAREAAGRSQTGLVAGMGLGAVAGYASFRTLEASANTAATSLNVMQNAALSAGQKHELLSRAIVPGYESFSRLRDAINGVTESLRRQAQAYDWTIFAQQARSQGAMQAAPYQYQSAALLAGRDTPASLPYAPFAVGQFNRATAEGAFGYDIYGRQHAAGMGVTQAQRDARNAEAGVATAGERVRDAQGRAGFLQGDADRASRTFDEFRNREGSYTVPRNPARRQLFADDARRAAEAAVQAQSRLQAELNQQIQAGNNLLEARRRLNEANLNVARTELQTQQQRTQAMMSSADRYGRMNPAARLMASQSLALVNRVGIDAVTDQTREQARMIDPARIGRLERASGERYAQGQAAAGNESDFAFRGGGTIADSQRREEQLQANIVNQLQISEEDLARRTADSITPILRSLVESLETRIRLEIRSFEAGQAQQNAHPG